MRKVKMRTRAAWPGGNLEPGQVESLPDAQAETFIEAGSADDLGPCGPETAALVPGERAVKPAPKARKVKAGKEAGKES